MDVIDSVTTKTSSKRFKSILDIPESQWDAVVPRATGLRHNILQTLLPRLACHTTRF